jgi:hypothetical protein
MKNHIFVMTLFLVAAASASAQPSADYPDSAKFLAGLCKNYETSAIDAGYCLGYVSGVVAALQTRQRGESRTPDGYFPERTPAQNADSLMGSNGATLRRLQPTICQILRKPLSGITIGSCIAKTPPNINQKKCATTGGFMQP